MSDIKVAISGGGSGSTNHSSSSVVKGDDTMGTIGCCCLRKGRDMMLMRFGEQSPFSHRMDEAAGRFEMHIGIYSSGGRQQHPISLQLPLFRSLRLVGCRGG